MSLMRYSFRLGLLFCPRQGFGVEISQTQSASETASSVAFKAIFKVPSVLLMIFLPERVINRQCKPLILIRATQGYYIRKDSWYPTQAGYHIFVTKIFLPVRCCFINRFYIKPQPSRGDTVTVDSCFTNRFYIKPQLSNDGLKDLNSCFTNRFYIKPKPALANDSLFKVALLIVSTSNRNCSYVKPS